jgi:hypothetical protein
VECECEAAKQMHEQPRARSQPGQGTRIQDRVRTARAEPEMRKGLRKSESRAQTGIFMHRIAHPPVPTCVSCVSRGPPPPWRDVLMAWPASETSRVLCQAPSKLKRDASPAGVHPLPLGHRRTPFTASSQLLACLSHLPGAHLRLLVGYAKSNRRAVWHIPLLVLCHERDCRSWLTTAWLPCVAASPRPMSPLPTPSC